MRKKWRDRIEKLECAVMNLKDRDLFYEEGLRRKDHTACDNCGCLIKKSDEFKMPSTVETRDLPVLHPSQYYYATVEVTRRKEEYLQEHYLCNKCKPKEKK